MKFSARVSYGLRAAIFLAEHHGGPPVLGKRISEAESLNPAYLEQVMASLRRADIVSGTRGAKGGYVLTRRPEQITVTQIIEALEGPLQLADCPAGASCCATPDACVVRELFAEGDRALREVFGTRRLSDLAERRREMRDTAPMYHI